jgi:hypothetical protein
MAGVIWQRGILMGSRSGIFPSLAVVIEWENAVLAKLSRTMRMLEQLRQQLTEIAPLLGEKAEVLFLYDQTRVSAEFIQKAVGKVFGNAQFCEVKVISTTGKRYYELKNESLLYTQKDLLVFLDSDVVPEDGWLRGLLKAFEQEDTKVVCGNTYVSPDGLYGKAMALFWFFPLRQDDEGLVTSNCFFANNVAFRREVLKKYPFPDLENFRGQCLSLARLMSNDGIPIHLQRSSRVSHPPPNGFWHFACRALCQGHDEALEARRGSSYGVMLGAAKRYFRSLREAYWEICRGYPKVQLSRFGGVCAFGIAAAYHSLALAGELVTRVHPSIVRRYFSI